MVAIPSFPNVGYEGQIHDVIRQPYVYPVYRTLLKNTSSCGFAMNVADLYGCTKGTRQQNCCIYSLSDRSQLYHRRHVVN
jgi:hypothetical protein